jgi:hypothetical protein
LSRIAADAREKRRDTDRQPVVKEQPTMVIVLDRKANSGFVVRTHLQLNVAADQHPNRQQRE